MKIIKHVCLVNILVYLGLIILISSIKTNTRRKLDDKIESPYFLQVTTENPDQPAGGSAGGDNGEFMRRNQPQEHIIIPLINSLEAEYNPLFSDIRKYRKKVTKKDKGIEYRKKINNLLN